MSARHGVFEMQTFIQTYKAHCRVADYNLDTAQFISKINTRMRPFTDGVTVLERREEGPYSFTTITDDGSTYLFHYTPAFARGGKHRFLITVTRINAAGQPYVIELLNEKVRDMA